jgi:hypothetical protein
MHKLSIIGAVVMLAACAFAVPRSATFTASSGTNFTATSQTLRLVGYVDEIVLELPSGCLTGTVVVTATPEIGSAVTLATKTITSTSLIRPRLDGTTTAGVALDGDPPGRYMSASDAFSVAVTDANATGGVWRVFIKFEDGK